MALANLSQRIFSEAHSLKQNASCPTMDTVLLGSQNDTKLSLWRVAGQADKVWDMDLQKSLQEFAWSPDGRYLACVTDNDRLDIVATQRGPSQIAHIRLSPAKALGEPPKKKRKVSCLSWHEFDPGNDSRADIPVQKLIHCLPKLGIKSRISDNLQKGGSDNQLASKIASTVGGSSGVSKNLPDGAASTFSLDQSFPSFPTLLPSSRTCSTGNQEIASSETDVLMFLAVDNSSSVMLYYNGSVPLGEIVLSEPNSTILAASILPSASTHPSYLSIGIWWTGSQSDSLHFDTYRLTSDSKALDGLAKATDFIHTYLLHIYKSLAKPLESWRDSQEAFEVWIEKIRSLSSEHGIETSATKQLMNLLMIGKASPALHEYFCSKSNEKNLTKWELAMSETASSLRSLAYQSLTPACERLVLWLEYLKAQNQCTVVEEMDNLNIEVIDECLVILQQLIKRLTDLERVAGMDEKVCQEFCRWIRYEGEIVNARENAGDTKILSKHDVYLVGKFIAGDLAFPDLKQLLLHDMKSDYAPDMTLSTDNSKEALESIKVALRSGKKPPAPASPREITESLPTLIDAVSSRLGGMLTNSFESFSKRAQQTLSVMIGPLKSSPNPLLKIRVRPGVGESAFITIMTTSTTLKGSRSPFLWIIRIDSNSEIRHVHYTFQIDDLTKLDLIDYDFFDDKEIALIGKTTSDDKVLDHLFATVDYSMIDWANALSGPISGKAPVTGAIPLSRIQQFGGQLIPTSMALNGRAGRRTGCLLGGEGRQMKVFDLEVEDSDEVVMEDA